MSYLSSYIVVVAAGAQYDDFYILVEYFINETMTLRNASGPFPGQFAFEPLGLAGSCFRMFLQFGEQTVDLFSA